MIVLTPTTAAAIALHAAEQAWVMFVQVTPNGSMGPVKIEGLRGTRLAERLNGLARDNAFPVQLIGLIPTVDPTTLVQQFVADFESTHMHDGWFEPSTELMGAIIAHGQHALHELLNETHPGSLDQEQLVDIDEMAQILAVSVPTVRRLISANKIPFLRAGRVYRFNPGEVIASLERQR